MSYLHQITRTLIVDPSLIAIECLSVNVWSLFVFCRMTSIKMKMIISTSIQLSGQMREFLAIPYCRVHISLTLLSSVPASYTQNQ